MENIPQIIEPIAQPQPVKPSISLHIIGWVLCFVSLGGLAAYFIGYHDVVMNESQASLAFKIVGLLYTTTAGWLLFAVLSLAMQAQTLARKVSAMLLLLPFALLLLLFIYTIIIWIFFPEQINLPF